MSVYTFDLSRDVRQANGSGVTATSTNFQRGIIRGGASTTNPLFRVVNVVDTNDQSYGSNLVGSLGKNNAPVNYEISLNSQCRIVEATGFPYSGLIRVEKNTGLFMQPVTGLKVGDTIFLRDASATVLPNAPTCFRVLSIIGTGSGALGGFVVNQKYTATSPALVSFGKAVTVSASSTDTKPLGYQVSNRYAIRGVEIIVHTGTSNVSLLGSPASLGNRRKLHSKTAVRSRLLATAIRSNFWNPYTGLFTTLPTLQNDFSTMGADQEIATPIKGYGVKGEFVYRYGAPTVALADYDNLS